MSQENIAQLKHLHDIGLIDDKAFIDAIKRATGPTEDVVPIMTKPLREKNVMRPLGTGTGLPFNEVPYTGTPFEWPSTSAKPLPSGTIIGLPSITSSCEKYVSKGSPLTATFTPEQVDVVPYTENRSHLPDHAQQVLKWIDEAWDNTFREYNNTKKDWERVEDEDGSVTWKHLPSEKVSRTVSHEVKELMEMFNLEVDHSNQP